MDKGVIDRGISAITECEQPVNMFTVLCFFRDVQPIPAHKEKKYIVFESKLMELFQTCSVCRRNLVVSLRNKGSLLKVCYECSYCNSKNSWESQPTIGSTPAGNVQLSAAVYLSGASYVKMVKVTQFCHMHSPLLLPAGFAICRT